MDIILGLLGQVLGMSADSLAAELKNADGELKPESDIKSFLESKFSEKLKAAEKKGRDEGIGRTKKETLSQLEKELASEYEIEEALPAKELIKKIIDSKTTSKADDPEAIKRSDIFLEAMRQEKAAQKAIQDQFDQYKSETAFKEKRSAVETTLPELLEKHKFVLPEKPTIRESHLKSFKGDLFNGVDFDVQDGKPTKVLGVDGKPLLDNLHNEITYEQYVVSKASNYFEIAAGDNRQGPNNKSTEGRASGGKQFNFGHITTKEAGMDQLYKTTDKEEREALAVHVKTLPA